MLDDIFPKTIVEFDEQFPTEDACRKFLMKIRWPDGFRCPRCGSDKCWPTGRLLECAACGRQVSVTAGTIFHRSRKPLRQWFQAMWWICTQRTGGSSHGLRRIMGMGTPRTSWTWLQKLRGAMVRVGREKLSGVVEVDDAYVGGEEEGVRGRETALKTKIVVAVEVRGKGAGRVRIRRVSEFSAENLIPFIEENVEQGSIVRTDGWPAYGSLGTKGYKHKVIVTGGDSKRIARYFPNVHRVISLLKRWLLGTHQGRVEPKHIQRYFDEFTFRFNRRRSEHVGRIFFRLLQQASSTPPESYRKIVGHPIPRKSRKTKRNLSQG